MRNLLTPTGRGLRRLLCLTGWLGGGWLGGAFPAGAQGTEASPVQTIQYSVEVAGLRVGRMTATRQTLPGNQTRYTLVSDVTANLLVYKVKVYYKVTNLFRDGHLLLSVVDARTNRGTYASRTEWKTDHYEITADQYKYTRRATEKTPIQFTVTHLYFAEPRRHDRVYGEYFGDFFNLTSGSRGKHLASLNNAEDEYQYENGQLVKVTKRNKLVNFVIRRLP